MSEKLKVCMGCREGKPLSSFTKRAIICHECENNPNFSFDLKCPKCGKTKHRSFFNLKERPCKECIHEYNVAKQKGSTLRDCEVCGVNKPAKEFRRGFKVCLQCETQQTSKVCVYCETEKPIAEFRPKRTECIECEREAGRHYRRDNPEKGQKWLEENKERSRQLIKNRYEEKKSEIREKERERIASDPEFRRIKRNRTGMLQLFRGDVKHNIHVGTSHELFKEWICFNFFEGMTIENRKVVWQFDHVLPLDVTLKTSVNQWCRDMAMDLEAIDTLFAWYNIRPLSVIENQLKSSKIDYQDLSNHYRKVVEFRKLKCMENDSSFLKYRRLLHRVFDFLKGRIPIRKPIAPPKRKIVVKKLEPLEDAPSPTSSPQPDPQPTSAPRRRFKILPLPLPEEEEQ